MIDLTRKNILVTGGNGFLGRHIVAALLGRGVPKEQIYTPPSRELNLVKWEDCVQAVEGRDIVIHLAAKVGGIAFSKDFPGESFYTNAIMGIQMTEAARQAGVEKFVGIGSVSSYPEHTQTPFKEEDLWNGYPGDGWASYGIAKKMMLVQAQMYKKQYDFNAIHLLLTNLYGPGDNFNPEYSHVIPALVLKVYRALEEGDDFVEVWGTGVATRDFLYVEDVANGILLAAEKLDRPVPVNLGSGVEISIREVVETISEVLGFGGEIRWDDSRPDGISRRVLDISRVKDLFGFEADTSFRDGIQKTVDWYIENKDKID